MKLAQVVFPGVLYVVSFSRSFFLALELPTLSLVLCSCSFVSNLPIGSSHLLLLQVNHFASSMPTLRLALLYRFPFS